MTRFLMIIAMLVLPVAAQAQAFEAINRLIVVPLSSTEFEVIESRGEGARGIWCAAADYVRTRGIQSADGRLYVARPRSAAQSVRGRAGVVFTVAPDDTLRDTPRSYTVTVRRAGENLPINHAYQFCEDYIIDLNDLF